jgi:hypothetical protein
LIFLIKFKIHRPMKWQPQLSISLKLFLALTRWEARG